MPCSRRLASPTAASTLHRPCPPPLTTRRLTLAPNPGINRILTRCQPRPARPNPNPAQASSTIIRSSASSGLSRSAPSCTTPLSKTTFSGTRTGWGTRSARSTTSRSPSETSSSHVHEARSGPAAHRCHPLTPTLTSHPHPGIIIAPHAPQTLSTVGLHQQLRGPVLHLGDAGLALGPGRRRFGTPRDT